MLNNFRAYQFAVQFYHLASTIEAKGELRDQLTRASSSIVLNLAEGSGKRFNPNDQRRFYRIALGSLRESQAILDLLNTQNTKLKQLADTLGAILHTLAK